MWPRPDFPLDVPLSETASIRAKHSSEDSLRMTIQIARKDAAYLVKVARGNTAPAFAGCRREALKALHIVRQRCTLAAQALRLQREARTATVTAALA